MTSNHPPPDELPVHQGPTLLDAIEEAEARRRDAEEPASRGSR